MARINLKTSYSDRIEVKILGAKWDLLDKTWFIEDPFELAIFSKWLPEGLPLTLIKKESALTRPGIPAASLSIFLNKIQAVVESAFKNPEWIVAEVSDMSFKSHFYLDLVEHAADGKLSAKCRAMIWSRDISRVNDKFKNATGTTLNAGMKVLLKVSTHLSSQFGLSLYIEDIDPSYTLGDMEAKLRSIREVLKREKIFNINKQLLVPTNYFRIAIVSPLGAAGLEDFKRDADILESNGICDFKYFYATFQGEKASDEVNRAIRAVFDEHNKNPFDVLCILRGGGATLDLNWLNEESLARLVCNAPLPVFTGIGHSVDSTILDEVACMAHHTPSKVIKYIEECILASVNDAENYAHSFFADAEKRLMNAHHLSTNLHLMLIESANKALANADNASIQFRKEIGSGAKHSLQMAKEKVDNYRRMVVDSSTSNIKLGESDVLSNMRVIASSAKSIILSRQGFLKQYLLEIQDGANRLIRVANVELNDTAKETAHYARQNIIRADADYSSTFQSIFLIGPAPTIMRGFAIARSNGKIVSDASLARNLTNLEIEFRDGRVNLVNKENI